MTQSEAKQFSSSYTILFDMSRPLVAFLCATQPWLLDVPKGTPASDMDRLQKRAMYVVVNMVVGKLEGHLLSFYGAAFQKLSNAEAIAIVDNLVDACWIDV